MVVWVRVSLLAVLRSLRKDNGTDCGAGLKSTGSLVFLQALGLMQIGLVLVWVNSGVTRRG